MAITPHSRAAASGANANVLVQKVSVVLEDDLTGGPAERTIRFAFEGTDYETDLNAKNAAKFSKQLAPYLEHARRAGRVQARRPGWTSAGRQHSGDIRAWATAHGLAVSERGRIPASVVEQYNAAAGRQHKSQLLRGARTAHRDSATAPPDGTAEQPVI
jgi:hypothetical protein